MQYFLLAYFALMLIASLIAFGMYGWDKWQAKRKGWRVPENTLHIWALLGGWPGALLGQKSFRHKTSKPSFRIVFWATVVVHVAAGLGGVYLLWK